MKKLFYIILFTLVVGMTITSCTEEGVEPITTNTGGGGGGGSADPLPSK